MDNPTSPHLPPDIPADRCPACGASMREHESDFPGQGRTPESHDFSAAVATWALIGFVLALAAAVIVAIWRA